MPSHDKRVVALLATLDTKGREADFLRQCIERRGHRALLIDTGVVGKPTTPSDISREKVAATGGGVWEELLQNPTREKIAPIMAAGARKLVGQLVADREIDAVLSLGGTQGTTLSTAVMRSLPFGFPKIMVSTMASGNVSGWVGTRDITMIHSVTDIMGLNKVSRRILTNAAAAACGMAEEYSDDSESERHLIALTTVGITTTGVMEAVEVLQRAGHETIVFHAVGTGGEAMEEMMVEGLIDAVLDFSTIEISNEMFGALLAGGPDRLTTAGKLGIPQVICPGAIEVLVFNEPHTVPARFADRTLVRHSPQITDLRLNKVEMALVGEEIGKRLQHTSDETVFLIPTSGYDSYATEGEPFYDPEADAAFVASLKQQVPQNVTVIERPTHINDPSFAREAAETLLELLADRAKVGVG
jgi:uncharacterized protein (UPF0261 family)